MTDKADSMYSPVILRNMNTPWLEVQHLGLASSFPAKHIFVGLQDGQNETFYLIIKGLVKLSYISVCGQDKTLFFLGQNTFFNDVPALLRGMLCMFTCVEPVEAIAFKRHETYNTEFTRQYPELILNWLESCSKKSTVFFSQLCSVGMYNSFICVCRLLYSMHLHQRQGEKIVPMLSQQDFSSLLGIHRGSLHKAFTRLRSEGIIGKYSRHELEIHDLKSLKAYAEQAQA